MKRINHFDDDEAREHYLSALASYFEDKRIEEMLNPEEIQDDDNDF
jgi:hypothetical protein